MENHVAAATEKYEKSMPVTRKRRGQSTPHHLRKQPIPLPLDDRKRKVSIPSSVGQSTSIASEVSAIGAASTSHLLILPGGQGRSQRI